MGAKFDVSDRETLETILLLSFQGGKELPEYNSSLFDSYVLVRAEEGGRPEAKVNDRYRRRVWKYLCKLADKRESEFAEMRAYRERIRWDTAGDDEERKKRDRDLFRHYTRMLPAVIAAL